MAIPEHHGQSQPITLAEAADRLGVHYMTAYRYVRTGRLAAVRDRGQWVVDEASLQSLLEGGEAISTGGTSRRRAYGTAREARRAELTTSLVKGDEGAAWRQIEDLLAGGLEAERLYLEVLMPVMQAIGDAWEAGELSIGAEHRASTLMQRLVGRLGPLFLSPGRKRGAIVLGAPAGDRHSLPVTLLADPLRGRRFEVVDLGADTPAESFAEVAASTDRLVGVGVCATTASRRSITEAIRAVHTAVPGIPVVLGGSAINDEASARKMGADSYSASAESVLEMFDELAG